MYIVITSFAWYFTYIVNVHENNETVAIADSSATTTVVFDENEIVYVTKNGGRYHKHDCPSIKNSKVYSVNIRQARENSKTECETCFG